MSYSQRDVHWPEADWYVLYVSKCFELPFLPDLQDAVNAALLRGGGGRRRALT